MADTNTTARHSRALIDDIEPTTDKLTGRAGLSLFTRYLRGIEIFSHRDRLFGSLRQSGKGQLGPIPEIFKQLFCFFLDGTSRHLVYFDALKQDEGYAGAIETGSKALLSSHAVKRFFGGFYMRISGCFAACCSSCSCGGGGWSAPAAADPLGPGYHGDGQR